jgi:hypothetical protein
MTDNDSDTFEIVADRSFFIDHEPVVREKKKDPTETDTIAKPKRKKKDKI